MPDTQDIGTLVRRDHQKVEVLFGSLETTSDANLVDYFCELREQLVRHEVAEEIVVYPAFRHNVPSGDGIANERMAEQAAAERLLARLDGEGDPVILRRGLEELRTDVLAHAAQEEQTILPALTSYSEAVELDQLAGRYESALESAPTHPHPHAPDSPPANIVVGPIAALADRFRDAMRKTA